MALSTEAAHRLAHFIEGVHAKERAKLKRGPGRGPKIAWAEEFDPLAATCLGDLIYNVANGLNTSFG